MQTYVPAGAMSGGVGAKSPIFQTLQINAQQQTDFVAEYQANDQNQEAYFTIAHRSLPFFNYTNPLLALYPVWMQIAGAQPSPDEFVLWEAGVGVAKQGETLDFTMEPSPAIQQVQSLVLGPWIHAGAGAAADQAIELPLVEIFGSTLDADDWNLLIFEIERFDEAAGDTFDGSAFLIGCMIQYATDFNNKAAWPTAP